MELISGSPGGCGRARPDPRRTAGTSLDRRRPPSLRHQFPGGFSNDPSSGLWLGSPPLSTRCPIEENPQKRPECSALRRLRLHAHAVWLIGRAAHGAIPAVGRQMPSRSGRSRGRGREPHDFGLSRCRESSWHVGGCLSQRRGTPSHWCVRRTALAVRQLRRLCFEWLVVLDSVAPPLAEHKQVSGN